MFRTVSSDVSATEFVILLPSKGALTPNRGVARAMRQKAKKKRKSARASWSYRCARSCVDLTYSVENVELH